MIVLLHKCLQCHSKRFQVCSVFVKVLTITFIPFANITTIVCTPVTIIVIVKIATLVVVNVTIYVCKFIVQHYSMMCVSHAVTVIIIDITHALLLITVSVGKQCDACRNGAQSEFS